jgi:hypothetical protein
MSAIGPKADFGTKSVADPDFEPPLAALAAPLSGAGKPVFS